MHQDKQLDLNKLSQICQGDKFLMADIANYIINEVLFTEDAMTEEKQLKEAHELCQAVSVLCDVREGVQPDSLKADFAAIISKAKNPELMASILGA